MRAPYSVHKRQYRHYYRHRDETLRAYALDRIVKGYALRISTLQRHSITPEDIRAQLIVARERGLAPAEVRFARSQIRQVYATGHYSHDQYTARMLEVAADFYQRIPERWLREGVNVYLRYDFAASTDASIPAELRHMGFTQPTAIDSDSPVYDGHDMTVLGSTNSLPDITTRVSAQGGLIELNEFVRRHILNQTFCKPWGKS
ncbi:hypothetical protein AB1Y20_016714 [Prymnesium parvum]|uniref:Uncharacterized protein n=1 Tax=Prymnesium parvum TaxID=97485 RepID=A0AB34IBU8_PRYPA